MVISVSADLARFFTLEMTRERLKKAIENAHNFGSARILAVTEILIEAQKKISSSFISSLPLELAIVKSAQLEMKNELSVEPKIIDTDEENKKKNKIPASQQKSQKIENINKQEKEDFRQSTDSQELKNSKANNDQQLNLIKSRWAKIVEATFPYNHSLMAFLSNCEPIKAENDRIIIATKYNLYKEKLNEEKNRSIVEKVAAEIIGLPAKISFITEEEAGVEINSQRKTNGAPKKAENGSLLDDALEIIGGKIVKE